MSAAMEYDALRAQYANGVPPPPADFSFVTHVFDDWAKKQPKQTAIWHVAGDLKTEHKISYAELVDLSHRAAILFAKHGIGFGDRVMMTLPRLSAWWICVFGLMRLGAVPIPGTTLLVAKDLHMRAKTSGAKAFIGCRASCPTFESIAGDVGVTTVFEISQDGERTKSGRIDLLGELERIPRGSRAPTRQQKSDDLALIYFTSGTTGPPKQVLLPACYTLGHINSGLWYRLEPGKVYLNLGDLGWAKAAYATFGTFNMGATLFCLNPPQGNYSAVHLVEALHRFPITNLCCPPTIYRSLLTTEVRKFYDAHKFKALEHAVSAGEPINGPVISAFAEMTGVTICDGWGQTETCIVVGNFRGVEIRLGSMGRVAPGVEVCVIGTDTELPDGAEGELCVRTDPGGGAGGSWIFSGYRKVDGTIDTRRRQLKDGRTFYLTGDRGRRDKDGYFWFVGRSDDIITSSGYRIGPFEVESALKSHPAVLESAAVASPDRQRTEIVKAFVTLSAEYHDQLTNGAIDEKKLIAELQDHCRRNAAPYKYPRQIEFMQQLPKNVSGKILRVELRNREYERNAHVVAAMRASKL